MHLAPTLFVNGPLLPSEDGVARQAGSNSRSSNYPGLACFMFRFLRRPQSAGIAAEKKGPLFRAIRKGNKLTENPMAREDVLAMIKRRAKVAALPYSTCCHTVRATGITPYMQNGGTLEHAQQIAAHESPRTTKLYDRTQDEISLDEVERIRI
jgi:integrase